MIHVDFAFVLSKGGVDTKVTILTAIDVRAQMAIAVVVPSKSSQNTHDPATERRRLMYETGRTQAIIQCDAEKAIQKLVQQVITAIGGLTLRVVPVGPSQRHDSSDRSHQTLFGSIEHYAWRWWTDL